MISGARWKSARERRYRRDRYDTVISGARWKSARESAGHRRDRCDTVISGARWKSARERRTSTRSMRDICKTPDASSASVREVGGASSTPEVRPTGRRSGCERRRRGRQGRRTRSRGARRSLFSPFPSHERGRPSPRLYGEVSRFEPSSVHVAEQISVDSAKTDA